MLDRDPAGLYGVRIKALKQAARRNSVGFPPEFMAAVLLWQVFDRTLSLCTGGLGRQQPAI